MAAKLISSPLIQAIDANGDPYSGAKLYVYDAGTTTLRTTYSDEDLSIANSNPLIADSAGLFGPIYVAESDTALKLSLYDSDDVLVWTQDDVLVAGLTTSYATTAEETSAGVTVVNSEYEVLNVLRYGTNTSPGVTDLTTAIQAAVDVANEMGGGRVYVPPGTFAITSPIYLYDNVTLAGDGYASHIKNTRTTSATSGDLRAVDFGNHTSTTLLAEDAYALDNAAEGDQSVTTSTASHAGNFSVGDVVYIGSTTLYGSIPSVQEFNEVTSVDSGTGVVGLKYGLHAAFTGGQEIYTTNSGQTDPLGRTRRVVKRCRVSNLRITTDGNDWWHAAGGCWESEFDNLFINSRSPAVLNCFARSSMRHVYSTFDDRAIELAIGSHDSVIEDFTLVYQSDGNSASGEPIISLGEGAHHNRFRKINISAGEYAGSYLLRFIQGKDNEVSEIVARANSLSSSDVVSFSASSGICLRNKVSDLTAYADNARFINFDYGVGVTGSLNSVVGSRFYGTASSNAVAFVDGTGDSVEDCYFETGGYSIGASSVDSRLRRCVFEIRHPTGTVSAPADVRELSSGSLPDLKSIEVVEVAEAVSATTPNNTVFTATIPIDTLEPGDVIEVEVHGTVTGTNDAKEIRLEAETTDVGSISLAAGESGAFSIFARITTAFATTTKTAIAQEESAAGANTRRSSFSLNTTTNTMNVDLEAWVANASDSITIDRYSVKVNRLYET